MPQQSLSPSSNPASITPTAGSDGIIYANQVPLTTTEASLFGGTGALAPDPIPTEYGQAICATIQLTINGLITGSTAYVIMQMDMGDNVWVDMNWLVSTIGQGTATFVFSNGIAGANTLQQSRNPGQPPTPQSNGSNQLALGGRIRFVGKATLISGSSSIAGTTPQVLVNIRYKVLGLR